MMDALKSRHIQVADNTSYFVPHWGYVDRVLPCTNDAGSCEYLDAVYWMHDISMLYTFILWAVIGGLLAIFIILRFLRPTGKGSTASPDAENQTSTGSSNGWYYRAWRGTQASLRRYLLPESFASIFGHTTRLQILTLAILSGYLIVFSFIGIVYKTWITPVKKTTLHNTRTGLGGFSDRIGALAYALTPFTVLLSTRESLLSLATGIPYQSFNFLHRWLGRIILIQAIVHTFSWTLIEGHFYQPQPAVYSEFIKEPYIIWGCVALAFLCFLYVFSIRRAIQWTGYEFFRKTHYVVACLYIGACWGHWKQLKCWMIASLGLFFLDRGIRLLRTWAIHTGFVNGYIGLEFHPAQATLEYHPDPDGGIIRLDFEHEHAPWAIGQHFYLCFPALSIWQSHPLTVSSVPSPGSKSQHHTYIIRCRNGETGRLKQLALNGQVSTPVVICGPYGKPLLGEKEESTNILAVAGGTGVTLTVPVVISALKKEGMKGAAVDFVWTVRRRSNIRWIGKELREMKRRSKESGVDLNIHIYVTQGDENESGDSAPVENISVMDEKGMDIDPGDGRSEKSIVGALDLDVKILDHQRPALKDILESFISTRASDQHRTRVIASGPADMGRDLRTSVAGMNSGSEVWRGRKSRDVELHWDSRDG
ncbi:hypothetical protein ACMFMF_007055 [Clarireedia jacksonii]